MIYAPHFSQVKNWQWKHFTPKELACKGTGELFISEALLDNLTTLRSLLKMSIIITSAYRSPLHNARIGGAPRSKHKDGTAVDILYGTTQSKLVSAAKEAGFKGMGLAKSFLHIDLGPTRTWNYGGKK